MNRMRTAAAAVAASAALALVAAPAMAQTPGGDQSPGTSSTTAPQQQRDYFGDDRYYGRGPGPRAGRQGWSGDDRGGFGPASPRQGRFDRGGGVFGIVAIGVGLLFGALVLFAGGGAAGYFLGRSHGRRQASSPPPSGPAPYGPPPVPAGPAPTGPSQAGSAPAGGDAADAGGDAAAGSTPDAPTEEVPSA